MFKEKDNTSCKLQQLHQSSWTVFLIVRHFLPLSISHLFIFLLFFFYNFPSILIKYFSRLYPSFLSISLFSFRHFSLPSLNLFSFNSPQVFLIFVFSFSLIVFHLFLSLIFLILSFTSLPAFHSPFAYLYLSPSLVLFSSTSFCFHSFDFFI